MNIAIIGAGNAGRALAGEVGAQAATSNKAAAEAADVVVLAIPYTAMVDLLDEIGDSLRGKISWT
jgi:predicted dinucleotide-binding enzyme